MIYSGQIKLLTPQLDGAQRLAQNKSTIREKERKSESKKESKVRYRESYQPKMSTQKVLISFDEYKKLKEVEKKYHDLQSQLSGKTVRLFSRFYFYKIIVYDV